MSVNTCEFCDYRGSDYCDKCSILCANKVGDCFAGVSVRGEFCDSCVELGLGWNK